MKVEKLELKHLAPYLPYGLTFCNKQTMNIVQNCGQKYAPTKLKSLSDGQMFLGKSEYSSPINNRNVTPLLRPLSDLTKEIEHNGKRFVPFDEIHTIHYPEVHFGDDDFQELEDIKYCPWWVLQYFFEWHFDVFGLIESGLAIDINTLNQ